MKNREARYYFGGLPRTKFEILTFVYGIFIVNLYDALTPMFVGASLLIIIIYVAPYLPMFFRGKLDLRNLIWLGILISLFNDIFFFFIASLVGTRKLTGTWFNSAIWYYSNWLLPQQTFLGVWDFLFFKLRVYSWMMALSIYARIIFLILTKSWRPSKNNNISQ